MHGYFQTSKNWRQKQITVYSFLQYCGMLTMYKVLRMQIYIKHSPYLLSVHWKGLTGRCVNKTVQQSFLGAIEMHTRLCQCTENGGLRVDMTKEVCERLGYRGWVGYPEYKQEQRSPTWTYTHHKDFTLEAGMKAMYSFHESSLTHCSQRFFCTVRFKLCQVVEVARIPPLLHYMS